MRQVKFRCWDKIEKKYRFDSFLKTGDGRGDWILFLSDQLQPETPDKLSFSANTVYPRDRFILEEFTNIKDNDGKEIYEGDIFRFVYSFDTNPHREWNSVVIFKNSCFGWEPLYPSSQHEDDQGFHSFFSEDDGEVPTNIEIVGNKLENPELLNSND